MNARKFIMTFLLSLIFIGLFMNISQASFIDDILNGANNFTNAGSNSTISLNETELENTSKTVNGGLMVISFVVVAVVGMILGIKLMTTDVENKAEAKKALMTFVIGIIVCYGAFGIWKAIVTFWQGW